MEHKQKNQIISFSPMFIFTTLQIFFTREIYSNTRKAGKNKTHYIQAKLVLNLAKNVVNSRSNTIQWYQPNYVAYGRDAQQTVCR